MARYFLRKLTIEGFRGINNQGNPLVLEFSAQHVTSIFGENGRGKSSVFEALEFAIYGETRRLATLQRAENPDRYYLNQFHQGPAVVTLVFQADDDGSTVTVTRKREKSGATSLHSPERSDAEGFLREIQAETLLMDYQTFSKFLTDTPLERGRSFARLLGLEKVSAVRAGLRSLSDTRGLNSDLDVNTVRTRVQTAQSSCRRAVEAALRQLSDVTPHTFTADTFDYRQVATVCLATLNQDPVISPLIAGKTLSTIDYAACLQRLQQSEQSREHTRLMELRLKLGGLGNPVDLAGLGTRVESLRQRIQERQALIERTKGEAFQALYKAAEQVLASDWSPQQCPLCERPWGEKEGLDLPAFVARELQRYQELVALDQTIRKDWQALVRDPSIAKLGHELAGKPAVALSAPLEGVDLPGEPELTAVQERFGALEAERIGAVASMQGEIAELEKRLSPSIIASIKAVTAAKNLTDSIHGYLRASADLKTASDEQAVIQSWQAFISEAAAAFDAAEAQLVQATVASLEDDIRSLYAAIMPGTAIKPKLSRETSSEQLHLLLEQFYGLTDAHALPLLSESYRNALGLAVFLAASRRRTYGGRFVVLDDVTSSFDSGHQSLLLEAIYNGVAVPQKPDGLQVILLSHDGYVRKYFDTAASTGKAWRNHRLHGTAPTGTVATLPIPVNKLRLDITDALSRGDLDTARRAVRPHLEASLLMVINRVGIRVPLDMAVNDDDRMLGAMMQAIRSDIDLHQKASVLILNAGAVTDITQNILPPLMANTWAHHPTDSGSSVDASAIQGVVDAIDRMVGAFQYTCKCDPAKPVQKFYRSLSKKQSGCGGTCT